VTWCVTEREHAAHGSRCARSERGTPRSNGRHRTVRAPARAPRNCGASTDYVKMAKAKDMPLTETALLGTCGGLKLLPALRVLGPRGSRSRLRA